MNQTKVELRSLEENDREQFILDNQEAFNFGALEEFGRRDDHFEDGDQIISRETIEESIDGGIALRIWENEQIVGGLILKIEGDKGELEILFVSPRVHSKGIGYAAWCQVEKMFPEVKVWECVTPYFETRNIHFYVNRCGFHIVEFFNRFHPDPNDPEMLEEYAAADAAERETGQSRPTLDEQFPDGMFRFQKVMEKENLHN